MGRDKFLSVAICIAIQLGIMAAFNYEVFSDDASCRQCHPTLEPVHWEKGAGCLECHVDPFSDKCEGSQMAANIREAHNSNESSSSLNGVDNPLSESDMDHLKSTIYEEVKKRIVGRKAVENYGPLGKGIQTITLDTYSPPGMANVDMLGIGEPKPVMTEKREVISIPEIYKDFFLFGRDLALSHGNHYSRDNGNNYYNDHHHFPIDPSAAIVAALYCVAREDDIIFNGLAEFKRPGIMNVEGRNTIKLSDWNIIGNGFENIANAIKILTGQGFYGPYVAVVNPELYARLHRVFEKTGELEIEGIKKLCEEGVYQTIALKNNKAVVLSKGIENMDLAIGQDLTLTYWGPEDLNHRFRIWESIALRIKNPKAICTIEP